MKNLPRALVALTLFSPWCVDRSEAVELAFVRHTYPASLAWPRSVDFDGDGDLDVIGINGPNLERIVLLENDGSSTPTFRERVLFVDALPLRSPVSADLDGDGDQDIVAVTLNGVWLSWFENEGGIFTRTHFDFGANGSTLHGFAVADLDGDGDLDVAGTSEQVGQGAFWLQSDGRAEPSFRKLVIEDNPSDQLESLAIADMDNDGDVDIVSGSFDPDGQRNGFVRVHVSDGRSTPTFAGQSFGVGLAINFVDVADVDGDGFLDIVSRSSREIAWYRNSSVQFLFFEERTVHTAGALSTINGSTIGDFDSDGDLDIGVVERGFGPFAGNALSWFESDGTPIPSFTRQLLIDPLSGSFLSCSDIDGDGDLDVLHDSGWFENRPPVRNITQGRAFATVQAAVSAASDGDKILAPSERFEIEPDIDLSRTAMTLASGADITQPHGGLYNLGDRAVLEAGRGRSARLGGTVDVAFGARAEIDASSTTVGGDGELRIDPSGRLHFAGRVRIGGTLDVAAGSQVSIDGDAKLVGLPGFTEHDVPDSDAVKFALADIDGDGDVDFVDKSDAWFENDGNLLAPSFVRRPLRANANPSAIADMDGDGDADLVALEFGSRRDPTGFVIFENDGAGNPTFSDDGVKIPLDEFDAWTIADFNGDGDLDILMTIPDDELLVWFENDGAADPTFERHEYQVVVVTGGGLVSCDLDGDEDLDVVLTSQRSTQTEIFWYENDGSALPRLTQRRLGTTFAGTASVTSADLDRDGDEDVILGTVAGSIVWFENQGGSPPRFSRRVAAEGLDQAVTVDVGDLDGDGSLDLAAIATKSASLHWFLSDGSSPPRFESFSAPATLDGGRSLAIADVNGDGDLDVLAVRISAGARSGILKRFDNVASAAGGIFGRGSALDVDGSLSMDAEVLLLDASVFAREGLMNAGRASGFGLFHAPFFENRDVLRLIGDTQVTGAFLNRGTTIIQNGRLSVLGCIENSGSIVGVLDNPGGGGAGADDEPDRGEVFFVGEDYTASSDATLRLPSADWTMSVGGSFSVAISEREQFDLSRATLQLLGPPGGEQSLEVLSRDVGRDERGLDPSLSGSFPIGHLVIGPTPTTVRLVDHHENSRSGEEAEAVYVDTLEVSPGATFDTSGFRVYYRRLVLGGAVTQPESLIDLSDIEFVRGDANGDGQIDVSDPIRTLLLLFRSPGDFGCTDAHDVNDDGEVNVTDPVVSLGHLFGGVAGRPTLACRRDSSGDELDCGVYEACP